MRLIDADAFIASIPNFDLPDDTIDACTLREHLMNAPTIDAVQVVRCNDCMYWLKGNVCVHKCKEDSFCSDGELK